MNLSKGIKLHFIYVKMKLMKNKKNVANIFMKFTCTQKLQQVLHWGLARVTSLLMQIPYGTGLCDGSSQVLGEGVLRCSL